jgi:catechol 2,3-dioxygenase-like lactoylglutathione lyase family enzyme
LGFLALDIALLIFFAVMAYRIASAVWRERPIFLEFHQPRALGAAVLLFPLGPIATVFLVRASPLLALLAGLGCYFQDPDGHVWEVAWNPQWPVPQ